MLCLLATLLNRYTLKLMNLQDNLQPMSGEEARATVREDLLDGRPLNELFREFDDEPLGAASIAQVHRAVLLDGREVAVKVQRSGIQKKLRGDLANLKVLAKALSGVLPVDYFKVFSELEKVVENELDFLQEAQAARKVAAAVAHTVDGKPTKASLRVPLPIPGLASRRVLVMDFIRGTPLSRLAKEKQQESQGEQANASVGRGRMSKIATRVKEGMYRMIGQRLLSQLTEGYGRMIFGAGFIHGDPHPGNLMLEGLDTGSPSLVLLDCGQFKQLANEDRIRIAQLVMLTAKRSAVFEDMDTAAKALGLELEPGSTKETTAAVALLLFGDTSVPLPGGYSQNELGSNSPLKAIAEFPQHLVLLGRACVMIKGIAKKLGLDWALAEKWKEAATHAATCKISANNKRRKRDGNVEEVVRRKVWQFIPKWLPCWSFNPGQNGQVSASSFPAATNPKTFFTGGVEATPGGGGGGGGEGGGEADLRVVVKSFASSIRLLATWLTLTM
eukprot:jgi/Bigna1/77603/fgenesh1_pg.49_\